MKDRLYSDQALAQFYDLDNDWGADLTFCTGLASGARSVLDLGCGTGRLVAHLAEGREAVGVDPAEAMLQIARTRPGGERAAWVEAPAQTVRLQRSFDLVLLTGHAFQVFLTEDDQRAVLITIAEHLAPSGRFIFDTRNPRRAEWREWTPERSRRSIAHPKLGRIEAWNDVSKGSDPDIVTYQTHYREAKSGREHEASSKLRFTPKARLAELIEAAGLKVDRWMGDWQGGPIDQNAPEIIPIGRLAG